MSIPEWSSAVVLIVVAILFALAIVYKQANNADWQQHSHQLSGKIRLYMAGSIVGNFTKTGFNTWIISRQDSTTSSDTDEKIKRSSPDMPSSSSTSSSLPTHNASPRLYKKTSNSHLASLRRQNSRHKQPGEIQCANTLSLIDDDVSEPLQSRNEERINVGTRQKIESKNVLHNQSSDYENEEKFNFEPQLHSPEGKSSVEFNEKSSTLKSNNNPPLLSQPNSSKSTILIDFANSPHQVETNHFTSHNQESDADAEVESIISDDHPELNPNSLGGVIISNKQKSGLDSNQDGRSVKPVQQNESRSFKQDKSGGHQSKHQNGSSHSFDSQRANQQQFESSKSTSYSLWQKSSRQQLNNNSNNNHSLTQYQNQHSSFLSLSNNNKRIMPSYTSHNSNGPSMPQPPIKAPSPENSKKFPNYQRPDPLWRPNVPAASHPSLSRNKSISNTSLNPSITRLSTYADVTAFNRSRSASTSIIEYAPSSSASLLTTSNNIMSPAPTASMSNGNRENNNQWYSPFSSGFTIQLTPPASPQTSHSHLPSENMTSNKTFSFFSALPGLPSINSSQTQYKSGLPPPIASSSSVSNSFNYPSAPSSPSYSPPELSSSSFPHLSSGNLQNHNSSLPTSPSSASFALFGRKIPLSDQEKGELSDEEYNSKLNGSPGRMNQKEWKLKDQVTIGKKGRSCGLGSQDDRQQREHLQRTTSQYSFFEKRESFASPSKS
ncbi:11704_t:CDS:2 [Ambispora leptoticha]|uniref:11704_t:CDS:1 n=1 Tax=Ambispora leptoticha TaxID=144679 RepID=A0A9N8W6S5_9GLOM|nr:11704_t:CDS:2 [Ambispora leptoticha]